MKQEISGGTKRLIVAVSLFLALILLAGAVLLTVTLVKDTRAIVVYKSEKADEGVIRCLASYYKSRVIGAMTAAGDVVFDDPDFWAMERSEGETFGDFLSASIRDYLAKTLVAAALYDEAHGFGKAEKQEVKAAVDEVVSLRAGGDRVKFSEQTAPYGFDVSDFEKAATLLYKAAHAEVSLYGEEGVRMQSLPDECEDFLSEYARVELLILRDSDTFALDENGNRQSDGAGNDLLRPLTTEEATLRAGLQKKLSDAIAAKENGTDGQITETMFHTVMEQCDDGDPDLRESGIYFRAGTAYTEEFREGYPALAEAALSMPVGSFREVSLDFGKCYLYRTEPVAGAYLDVGLDSFFSDFFSLAADRAYALTLATLAEEVDFRDGFSRLDFALLPYNTLYTVRF